ncbi:hypothetical protein [Kribbella sp. NPDC048915]|uniref:hypothetical protein n=1 Tax=Kribbella sp. NPDC048915 TaxID=3155148 RepID=UPI0033D89BC4
MYVRRPVVVVRQLADARTATLVRWTLVRRTLVRRAVAVRAVAVRLVFYAECSRDRSCTPPPASAPLAH